MFECDVLYHEIALRRKIDAGKLPVGSEIIVRNAERHKNITWALVIAGYQFRRTPCGGGVYVLEITAPPMEQRKDLLDALKYVLAGFRHPVEMVPKEDIDRVSRMVQLREKLEMHLGEDE